jgi:hypothetical protein
VQLRDFDNASEAMARRVVVRALEGTPYWVNVHIRLEDVIKPDDGDDPADVRFLRNAHFDLTIHKESHRKALWAFEFDGPTHERPEQRRRDIRKNSICLLAGLPLLRINDTHLSVNEKQAVLDWHIRRWMAYEKLMPKMLEERDREIAAMSEEEIRQAGFWLLGERPDLDVEMIFELEHPYEPTVRVAERLYQRYGMYATHLERPASEQSVRYLIQFDWMGAVPDLHVQGFHARWLCPVRVDRYDGQASSTRDEPKTVFESTGVWESRVAYPVTEAPEPQSASLAEWAAAGGWLPAGPAGGGAYEIGKVLAEYNALREVELWADRALGPRRVSG